MGIILFTIARLLQWILTPIFFIYAIIRLHNLKKISEYFGEVAFSIDQLGNVMGGCMMNDILLKKEPAELYGNPDVTISHVTGINYLTNDLTWCGKLVARILDKVERNHVEKAARTNQNNIIDQTTINS